MRKKITCLLFLASLVMPLSVYAHTYEKEVIYNQMLTFWENKNFSAIDSYVEELEQNCNEFIPAIIAIVFYKSCFTGDHQGSLVLLKKVRDYLETNNIEDADSLINILNYEITSIESYLQEGITDTPNPEDLRTHFDGVLSIKETPILSLIPLFPDEDIIE